MEFESELHKKLQLYEFASAWFDEGKSHPQVVQLMLEFADPNFARYITDKAEKDSWKKLFDKAKALFAEGKIYGDVLNELKQEGEDEEITQYAADAFYAVKTTEMENIVDGSTNRSEGLLWVIISGVVVPFTFILDASIIQKILWSLLFVGALARYIFGLRQRKQQQVIQQFFTPEDADHSVQKN